MKVENLKLALVIGAESQGLDYNHLEPDLVIIGNEPDGGPPSSWVMTQDEYKELWAVHSVLYSCPLVAAGSASGDPAWWDSVMPLEGCTAMNVHPYGKTPQETAELVTAYQLRFNLLTHIGEWNRPAEEIDEYLAILNKDNRILSWFCWSDTMVPGYGLLEYEDGYRRFLQHERRARYSRFNGTER